MIPEGQGKHARSEQKIQPTGRYSTLILFSHFHFWNSLLWILPFLLLVKLFRCDLFLGNEVTESFAQPLLDGCPKQQRPMSLNDILHCVPQYLHCVPQSPLRFARPSWHQPGKDNIWCICCITWSLRNIFFLTTIYGASRKKVCFEIHWGGSEGCNLQTNSYSHLNEF